MIIELIGSKAVGKTTVAPLVATRLGIAHYLGQAFHGLDGQRLTSPQEWADRLGSVARAPRLFVLTMRSRDASAKARIRFALNTSRRDRYAARASRAGDGVMESGPLHSLCQASASFSRDMTQLLPYIFHADIYVRLQADPAEISRRLAARGGITPQRLAEHEQWTKRYEESADEMLSRIGGRALVVDASSPPKKVAEEIAKSLIPMLGRES